MGRDEGGRDNEVASGLFKLGLVQHGIYCACEGRVVVWLGRSFGNHFLRTQAMANYEDGINEVTNTASPYLGAGILASLFGVAFVFNHQPSLSERAGSTFFWIALSAALALPLFIIWRFYSRSGRSTPLPRAFNVFCYFAVATCCLVLASKAISSRPAAERPVAYEKLRPDLVSAGFVPPASFEERDWHVTLVGCQMGESTYLGGNPLLAKSFWRTSELSSAPVPAKGFK